VSAPDAYGYITDERGRRARRHPKCSCEVPCQRRYECLSLRHRGPRSTPFCSGGWSGDVTDDHCDECCSRERARARAALKTAFKTNVERATRRSQKRRAA